MHTSCAMMTSRVIPPVEDEGAEVEEAEEAKEARGVALSVRGRLDQS